MFKQSIEKALAKIPLFLAYCAGEIILGFVLFVLFKWVVSWFTDVIIVALVLLTVAIPSIWKNPRCLSLNLRLILLGALSGKDILIANAKINFNRTCIYVEQDTDIIARNSHINYNEDYAVRLESGCGGIFEKVELINYNCNNGCAMSLEAER